MADSELLRVVLEQMSGGDDDENRETLGEVAEYGAAAGWGGFTYYVDTCAFYDEHRDLLWELLGEQAEEFGHASVPEFVGTFATKVHDETGFKNLVSWWALETAAREVAP